MRMTITEPKGYTKTYDLNGDLKPHVLDKICTEILRHFHPNSIIDFEE